MFEGRHRFEFKYPLSPLSALKAHTFIERFMKPDPVAPNGRYTVTSLYYDTPMLADYYDKSGGFLIRKKLRARIYEPALSSQTTQIWLEIKKKYDMAFEKYRIAISLDDWDLLKNRHYSALLSKERTPHDRAILGQFIWYMIKEGRHPSFLIRYQRMPYILEAKNPLRITFDSAIETHPGNNLVNLLRMRSIRAGSVMEVKFTTRLPHWFGIMIRSLQLERTSFSKYSRSIDAWHCYNPRAR